MRYDGFVDDRGIWWKVLRVEEVKKEKQNKNHKKCKSRK